MVGLHRPDLITQPEHVYFKYRMCINGMRPFTQALFLHLKCLDWLIFSLEMTDRLPTKLR
jgi:hypothetical protein